MGPSVHFLLNLRAETADAFTLAALSPNGYLVPPQRAGRTLMELATRLSDSGLETLVDNGNFATLGRVREIHADAAASVSAAIRELETKLERSARRRDVPPLLRKRLEALRKGAVASVASLSQSQSDQLSRQLSLSPSRLIGVEDIVPACLLALDIEPRLNGSDRASLRRRNGKVARAAARVSAALPAALRRNYFPVASASSYNTAYDAARLFASVGHRRIAMGFGAYMADNNYVDHFRVGRRTIVLERRIPNRYLRTILVARGFLDGYVAEFGRPPLGIHFLGLGAPIMLPLVSLAAWGTAELTFDATSPVKDATRGGTLYVSKPAYLKIRTRNVARRIATTNTQWRCPCPYCQQFLRSYPFKYTEARRLWRAAGRTDVLASDLTQGGLLFDSMPLLSEPRGGPVRKSVNYARTGHNHWTLFEVLRELREAGSRKSQVRRHVSGIVEAYQRTALPAFAFALGVALRQATAV